MALQSAIINVMKQAARKASVRLKRDYGEVDQLQVSQKGPSDFVTTADIRTERIIKEELTRARPNFGFLKRQVKLKVIILIVAGSSTPLTGPLISSTALLILLFV